MTQARHPISGFEKVDWLGHWTNVRRPPRRRFTIALRHHFNQRGSERANTRIT
ncbi:MAG TPA: hypothetical protein VLI90_04385 [Tepidisphaeraceae bacterium]|nr:hypothetical protein [Tepidisphaeraceae bacterium]